MLLYQDSPHDIAVDVLLAAVVGAVVAVNNNYYIDFQDVVDIIDVLEVTMAVVDVFLADFVAMEIYKSHHVVVVDHQQMSVDIAVVGHMN